MAQRTMNTQGAAAEYIVKRCWAPIPFKTKTKGPVRDGWQNERHEVEDVQDEFNANDNIGVLTGKPSGGLVDMDLDTSFARRVARYFAPDTGAVFGRESNPSSHYFYYSDGLEKTIQYTWVKKDGKDDGKKESVMILELRSNGAQTMVPPSIHPSGEVVRWEKYDEPAKVEKGELIQAANKIAAAAVLAQAWPDIGARQNAAMALSGGLLRAGWSVNQVDLFMQAICDAANDDEFEMRLKTIKSSAEKIEEGSEVTGFPTLKELIGDHAVNLAVKWLGIQQAEDTRFFKKKTFIPKRLADALMAEFTVKKGYDSLWLYKDGYYQQGAEDVLRKRGAELLDENYSPFRVESSIRYIYDILPNEQIHEDTRVINLKNGRLDWKAGELKPHDPAIFEVSQIPVVYDPKAECPVFNKYLETTLEPDVHPLIEEMLGYFLIPDTKTMRKAFMVYGSGANGKSVLLDVIENLLGINNVSGVPLQSLEEDKFKTAQLLGKLANIFADLDSRALKGSSFFKTLTSGDLLEVERKYGQPFKFRNYARLIFSANEIPMSNDRTFAFYSRWVLIPFEKTFKEGENADVTLPKKLAKPEELSGILNRGLVGLKRLFSSSSPKFTIPESVEQALHDYQVKNDVVASFIEDCVEKNPSGAVEKQYLYRTFKLWCRQSGNTILSEKKFIDGIKRVIPDIEEIRPRGENGKMLSRRWAGVVLTDTAPDPDYESSYDDFDFLR